MTYEKWNKKVEEGLLKKFAEYCDNDIRVTEAMYNSRRIFGGLRITKVIFNDPATIVFWNDGSKTVVKAQLNEKYDPEKGLAMAITKKALGNGGNYYNTMKKLLKEGDYGVEKV